MFVFGDACVWMPRRIPRVLSVFCYLMTFLWLRPAARCLAVGTVRIVLIAELSGGFFQRHYWLHLPRRRLLPWVACKGSMLSSRQRGSQQSTHRREAEREAVAVFFFQWWLLSTYTLLLIYSNCGWDSLLTAKKTEFLRRPDWVFLGTSSYNPQHIVPGGVLILLSLLVVCLFQYHSMNQSYSAPFAVGDTWLLLNTA